MQASWNKEYNSKYSTGSNNACQDFDSTIGSLKLQDIDMYIFRKNLKHVLCKKRNSPGRCLLGLGTDLLARQVLLVFDYLLNK